MSLTDKITLLTEAIRNKFNSINPRLIPSGGTVGQVLTKKTVSNYDTEWVDGNTDGAVDESFVVTMSITFGGR